MSQLSVTVTTYNKVLVDHVVSVLDTLQVGLEAFLPTFEHLLLDAEVAQVLGSVGDENVPLLLLLLGNLLPDDLLVVATLLRQVIRCLLLAGQVDEVALVERIDGLKLSLVLDDELLLLRSVVCRDVLESDLTTH